MDTVIYLLNVFWHVAPCGLVITGRRFKDAYRLHHQDSDHSDVDAASASEMSVKLYQTTRRDMPEDKHLHIRGRENRESQIYLLFA